MKCIKPIYTLVGTTVLGIVAGLSFLNKGYRAKPTYCILYTLSKKKILVIKNSTQLQLTKEQFASVP